MTYMQSCIIQCAVCQSFVTLIFNYITVVIEINLIEI